MVSLGSFGGLCNISDVKVLKRYSSPSFELIAETLCEGIDNYGGIQAITFLGKLPILKKTELKKTEIFLTQDPMRLQISKSYSDSFELISANLYEDINNLEGYRLLLFLAFYQLSNMY